MRRIEPHRVPSMLALIERAARQRDGRVIYDEYNRLTGDVYMLCAEPLTESAAGRIKRLSARRRCVRHEMSALMDVTGADVIMNAGVALAWRAADVQVVVDTRKLERCFREAFEACAVQVCAGRLVWHK
jgi:hypothetical protein